MSYLFEMFTFLGNNVLFLGDFNCDMIHPDLFVILKNLVMQSTRVTKSTEALTDLILTNNKRRLLQTGYLDTQISDHSLVYTIMPVTLLRLRKRKIAFICSKNFDQDKFLEDLCVSPFRIMDIFDDPDDMLYVFGSLYNVVIQSGGKWAK